MIQCTSCGKVKDFESFSINRSVENGRQAHCRECQRARRIAARKQRDPGWERKTADMPAYQKVYRATHRAELREWEREDRKRFPEKWAAKTRVKYERKQRRLHGEGWVPGRAPVDPVVSAAKRRARNRRKAVRQRERHPERVLAKTAVKNALRRGLLVRLPCFVCGDPKAHGHHPDYSAPLDVVWLCAPHHREVHAMVR